MKTQMPNSLVRVAALCVSGRSIYKYMEGVECYDEKRGAQNFKANMPAVARRAKRLDAKEGS